MKKENTKRYVLRVYDRSLPYDDDIYWSEENNDKIEVQFEADSLPGILDIWYANSEEYEGSTYCIKDMEEDDLIVGGIWDPNDDEIIKEHFPFEINDFLNPLVACVRKDEGFQTIRAANIKEGDTFFVDGEPYLAVKDANADVDGGLIVSESCDSIDKFYFSDLDTEVPRKMKKNAAKYAMTQIPYGKKESIILSAEQIEAVYRYREHQYHMCDADHQLISFIFGWSAFEDYADFISARDDLDEGKLECLEMFERKYGLTIEEAYALREDFVSRFEDNFDCNVAINDTWEESIREVLNEYSKAKAVEAAKAMYLPVHISEIKEGDVILFDGWEYTATSDAYMTTTDKGREWNVEIEGDGPESYIYASYFPNGEVPVKQ